MNREGKKCIKKVRVKIRLSGACVSISLKYNILANSRTYHSRSIVDEIKCKSSKAHTPKKKPSATVFCSRFFFFLLLFSTSFHAFICLLSYFVSLLLLFNSFPTANISFAAFLLIFMHQAC